MQMLATAFGEVTREDPQQLVQIRAQRAVGRLLHSEVLEYRDAPGGGDPPGGRPQQILVDPADPGVLGDRDARQCGADLLDTVHVLSEKRFVTEAFLYQDSGERGQAPGVCARLDAEVEVGEFRSIGEHRVDDDHRPRRIFRDVVQHDAGPGEALRHPRVLADEHRHLGVLELPAGVAAVKVRVHPGLAGLLLCQGIGAVARAQRFEERAAIGAAEMVALPAAAVVEDLVPAVF